MKRNAFFHYKVVYCDDYCVENVIEDGITIGTSLAEALDNITNYYGDDNIEEIKISYMTNYDGVIDLATLHASLEEKGSLD